MTQTITSSEQLVRLFEQTPPTTLEASDISYIDALRQRWAALAVEAGLLPLSGLVNVRDLPRKYTMHPLEYWSVERISRDELQHFAIPAEAQEKLELACIGEIPLKWLLWVEQHVTPPKVEYKQETVYVTRKVTREYTDPILIALIEAGHDVGIPYLVHCWLHNEH